MIKLGLQLLVGFIVFLLLFLSPLIGLFVQPWAPWWMQGSNAQPIVVSPGAIDPGIVGAIELNPPSAPAPSVDAPAPGAGTLGLLMAIIQPWMGDPYVFGGCSMTRGADCSCFVEQTAARLGVQLPRTAQLQWNVTDRTDSPQPGDLVFFQHTYDSPDRITHVGWYIGNGQMISEAEPAVAVQSLNSPFWRAHLAGFGRLRGLPPSGQA